MAKRTRREDRAAETLVGALPRITERMQDWVSIDWDDVPWENAKKEVLKLLNGSALLAYAVVSVWGRRSANGRTHLIVELREPFENARNRIMVRRALGDDLKRCEWDELRSRVSKLVDYSRGVLFDRKGAKSAGEWEKMAFKVAR